MKKTWVKYLCDPLDKSNIRIHKIFLEKGGYIISGKLKSKSGNIYEIKNGVPIMVNSFSQKVDSVGSFEYEWKTFDFDFGKKGWKKDIVYPILGGTKYFYGKTIIDCGAGSGRQSLWMAEAGAKFIFSVELSDAATSIVKKLANKYKRNVFVIQADIANMPIKLKSMKIDLLYCVNVIQHTKNPTKTLIEISKYVSNKSVLLFNIYLEKGKQWFLPLLNLIRYMVRRMPHWIIRIIALVFSVICFSLFYIPFLGGYIRNKLSLNHGFKETWLTIYDILGNHEYQKFYTEKELGTMLKKAGLKIERFERYVMLLKKM